MVNVPVADVTAVDLPAVASFTATTVAPGTTPPAVSSTTP
jgi:hypothetical protein